ncbi:hypothetical protein PTSG_05335 [Salpingoeca rosetta]|uniref:Uncharacterized protein n=1 Tax=Salpingoeca rosetta (strain ATCC 50818 / BSB-021) TaxID=946362 RepID=F2UA53_SALR5|nr:uncharacterized protein PTSG_05335 [Salpingoeca rosetta]EGD73628.1 hypothetical protein PTSG_05335 [Salpingoeca rosetta]|eukprot:XP_004993909.1 hypothetical protein PTSG_05335 [Salpingoeca rosetta]
MHTQVSVTVGFGGVSDPAVIAGSPGADFDVPDDRYELRFQVVDAAAAYPLALSALDAARVPTVSVTVRNNLVEAIIVNASRVRALASQPQLVPGSIDGPVSRDAQLTAEDAAEAVHRLVAAGLLDGEVLGRRVIATSVAAAPGTVSTMVAPVSTSTSASAPIFTASQPAGNPHTSVAAWPVAVGVAVAAILVVTLLVLVVRMRRNRIQLKSTSSARGQQQSDMPLYENPLFTPSTGDGAAAAVPVVRAQHAWDDTTYDTQAASQRGGTPRLRARCDGLQSGYCETNFNANADAAYDVVRQPTSFALHRWGDEEYDI